jgi:alanine dehydrogenase
MKTVSAGGAELPLRSAIPVGGTNRMGVMPGAVSDPACFGVKLVSLFPNNPDNGLSSHLGAVVLFDAATGQASAMMDAGLITAMRTAAASAVATRALARPDAPRLAIIGYGEQAEHHLDAICAVRDITHVTLAGRSAEKAAAFCEAAQIRYPDIVFGSGTDVAAAVRDADIICTVTSIPSMREVDDALVLNTSIWVDYRPSTLAQAGEIVDLIAAHRYSADQLQGEIGQVLSGDIQGRTSPQQQTTYRSLGVAAQDLAVAHSLFTLADRQGIGQVVKL